MPEFRWETVLDQGGRDLYVDGVKRAEVRLDTGRWACRVAPWRWEVEVANDPEVDGIMGSAENVREAMAEAEQAIREDSEAGIKRDARKAPEATMEGFYRGEDGKIAVLVSSGR